MISRQFYPFAITGSRYRGTYADGRYILISGVANIRSDTNALANDIDCMSFWSEVRANGPLVIVNTETGGVEMGIDESKIKNKNTKYVKVCAMAEDHPSVLFERFSDLREKTQVKEIGNQIDSVLKQHNELYTNAEEGDEIAYTKLWLLSYKMVNTQATDLLREEFPKRFLTFENVPDRPDKQTEEYAEVESFLNEHNESIPEVII